MDAARSELVEWVGDARARTLALFAAIDDAQLLGPRLAIVNPPLWEAGHVAWFQERWVLRGLAGARPLLANADALYDSSAVPHGTRWSLDLPSRDATAAYLQTTRDGVLAWLERHPADDATRYFVRLATLHEDMHAEAFGYTRQTLGCAPPPFARGPEVRPAGPHEGDVEVPGGTFVLGAAPGGEAFVFDNEKWAHPRAVAPFAIARAAVTQREFAAFVDDGGYARREVWTDAGWAWREAASATHPVYWLRDGARGWARRDFDRVVPLEPHRPVVHVCAHEAEAYCRWAGRRLPTELEWEVAAAGERDGAALARARRRYPWGDAPPDAARANLGWRAGGCVDVAAHPEGDSAFGCRQMLGNVWEWTATTFAPYPGFAADPYEDYSRPWFGTHRVLRGGCWATAPRLARAAYRNFFTPDRRDVFAGFRTCAP